MNINMDIFVRNSMRLFFAWCFVMGFSSHAFAMQNDTETALVDSFFPQQLSEYSNNIAASGGPAPSRFSAYADADLNGVGKKNYIIAAYSNGFGGAVRVLKKVGQSATLVASPTFSGMGGIFPSVEMKDIDGDGRPEAIVGFSSANGRYESDWVLKWDGTTLHSIAPAVFGALFMDLVGNGKMSIISAMDDTQTYPVYSLSNGAYIKSGSLITWKTFRRDTGAPSKVYTVFPCSDTTSHYVVTLVNGAGTSKSVSSAVIKLNDTIIADQNQFNQQIKVIKIPVTLEALNSLSVTLYGAPGSLLTVTVGKDVSQ